LRPNPTEVRDEEAHLLGRRGGAFVQRLLPHVGSLVRTALRRGAGWLRPLHAGGAAAMLPGAGGQFATMLPTAGAAIDELAAQPHDRAVRAVSVSG
jgi:hypothetical protein